MSKKVWLFVAVLALAVIAPQIVYAATGTFSSSSSATALTAVNTGSGRAINASSNTGYTGVFTRSATSGTTPTIYAIQKSGTSGTSAVYGFSSNTGSGATYGVYGRSGAVAGRGMFGYATRTTGLNFGVYGRSLSATDNASGVYGLASAGTGFTNGVWGQASSDDGSGVFGYATGPNGFGVAGLGYFVGVAGSTAGTPGDGSFGVVSFEDTLLRGHLMADGEDIAGECTVAVSDTTVDCPFANAFLTGTNPVVVLTPRENPAGNYWVTDPTTGTGDEAFAIHLGTAAGGDGVTFGFIVIGANPTVFASAAVRSMDGRFSRLASQR